MRPHTCRSKNCRYDKSHAAAQTKSIPIVLDDVWDDGRDLQAMNAPIIGYYY